jgi:hypothetical protein
MRVEFEESGHERDQLLGEHGQLNVYAWLYQRPLFY